MKEIIFLVFYKEPIWSILQEVPKGVEKVNKLYLGAKSNLPVYSLGSFRNILFSLRFLNAYRVKRKLI